MTKFNGKTVAIIGISIEGKDTIDFFLAEGCTIICCDRRQESALADTLALYKDTSVTFHCGATYLDNIEGADLIVRTPGMSLKTPELVLAKNRGIEVTSATKLFFELCAAPIIGVTGTKGKGTTSTLIRDITEASGKTVFLGGNVGVSLLSRVRSIKQSDVVVYELSSFQLEDMSLSPHVAVVLRITEDHLANFDVNATNYHETREAYVEAKSNIVRHQNSDDIAVINRGDSTARSFADMTTAKKVYFDRYGTEADCYVENHTVQLVEEGVIVEIANASTIQVRGDHNLEDIAAATLACRSIGIPIPTIQKAVLAFKGLEHRLEFVRTVREVSYYNDSFSTVPDTTIAAIESFEEPKVLILGGSEKKSDFTIMGEYIAKSNVVGAVVVGEMTTRITEALTSAQFKGKILAGCKNMHEIVAQAAKLAKPGSVVLLSPACASFGMFTNYKERGKQFKHEVLTLA
ncbi:MAG: UDP-N-acetylmuramoyl-L-alanine--D-glutamate ligase [Microgenomates group bacterium]